jgi:hypothetical protein
MEKSEINGEKFVRRAARAWRLRRKPERHMYTCIGSSCDCLEQLAPFTRVTVDLPVRPTVTRVSTSSCFCAQSPALGAVQGPPDLKAQHRQLGASRCAWMAAERRQTRMHASAENGGSGAGGATLARPEAASSVVLRPSVLRLYSGL